VFFERDDIVFNILDVLYLNQENVNIFNSGRNFNALSFRFSAETVLKTENQECHLREHSVSCVPARLDYTRISKKDEMIVIHFETINHNMTNIEYFEARSPDVLSKLFRDIFELWNKKDIGYKLRCSAVLYDIFAECYLQNYRQPQSNAKIQASIDYINQNYKNSHLTIKEIAEKSFMSEVYFRKLFKQEYGISPQKHIVNLRIQYASGLISTEYYSLKDVAYMSGYNDYKYFLVEFKRIKGVSPSEYLYNYKKKNL